MASSYNYTQNHVEIQEMDPNVLKEILIYIYWGKAPNIRQMAIKLLAAADMYLLDRLKSMCEDILCSCLTVDNAAETLILGDLHQVQHIKNDAVTFINVAILKEKKVRLSPERGVVV
ncbi:speckle-type POZ protein-like [Denticeps clupeoides]|uniref:speckle-type POZ protein-like n=1 Tax=Denticeps clupeoides TaxID=299321 RepID=UPI0010A3E465|nr:speckle-type POZ protein-like [Denticeps clupeoides]